MLAGFAEELPFVSVAKPIEKNWKSRTVRTATLNGKRGPNFDLMNHGN